MSAATLAAPTTVTTLVTDDGMLVRLAGTLDAASAPQLRDSLLRTRPVGCDDVIVDAGDVATVDDDALAVLLAGSVWAVDSGGRLSFSRMSAALTREVDALGFGAALPMLEPASARPATAMEQRTASAR